MPGLEEGQRPVSGGVWQATNCSINELPSKLPILSATFAITLGVLVQPMHESLADSVTYIGLLFFAFLVFLGLLSQLSFAYLHSKLKNVVAISFFCSLCLRASVLFFILYCDCWWGIVLKDRAKCMSSVSFKATVFLKLCYFYLIVRWDAFLRTQDL